MRGTADRARYLLPSKQTSSSYFPRTSSDRRVTSLRIYASAYRVDMGISTHLRIYRGVLICRYMANLQEKFVIIRILEGTRNRLKVKAAKERKFIYQIVDTIR